MKSISIILVILLVSTISWAQESETNADLGIQFSYPSNWNLTPKEGGYLLSVEKREGFVLIKIEAYKSLKKMKDSMQNGITQEDGAVLTLLNELQPYGENGLAGMYEGTIDEKKMKGFLIGKFHEKTNKSAITIVIAPADRFNQSHIDALKMIGRSLKFL